MNFKEMNRLEVMQKLAERGMNQKKAAKELGISPRQVKRLWKRYREKGAVGLVSQQRGKASHNHLAEATERAVVDLLHSRYADFGPTLAQEKLVEKDGLEISVSSVRKIMIVEELWKAKRARKVQAYQMRERRACFGELVQIDGSPYDWFEGRAPRCTLLVFIDDATGKLVQLLFAESESFFSYCQAAEGYFTRCGKPGAFYSDKHGIFRVNQPTRGKTDALTQFGRAMQELHIQIICANTPQAKGRVERANQTLQDRLPKELRLRGISDWEAGNAFLPEFMDDFNHRFAVQPRSSYDAHRPLSKANDLAHTLTWRESRTLSNNLTLQFRNVVYQVQLDRPSYTMRKAPVTISLDVHQNVSILYKGKSLSFTIFHKQAKQSEVVPAKHIDSILKYQHKGTIPAPNHPWRKYPNKQNVPKGDILT
ncbi:MAG TPA: ISNCY family transposase [Anaerolineales bacterium]